MKVKVLFLERNKKGVEEVILPKHCDALFDTIVAQTPFVKTEGTNAYAVVLRVEGVDRTTNLPKLVVHDMQVRSPGNECPTGFSNGFYRSNETALAECWENFDTRARRLMMLAAPAPRYDEQQLRLMIDALATYAGSVTDGDKEDRATELYKKLELLLPD